MNYFLLQNTKGEIMNNGLVVLFHAVTMNGDWSFHASKKHNKFIKINNNNPDNLCLKSKKSSQAIWQLSCESHLSNGFRRLLHIYSKLETFHPFQTSHFIVNAWKTIHKIFRISAFMFLSRKNVIRLVTIWGWWVNVHYLKYISVIFTLVM